jgi:hypothetical protein
MLGEGAFWRRAAVEDKKKAARLRARLLAFSGTRSF